MIDKQTKKHVMSCFHKDIYVGLKQPQIGYTIITTTRIFEYLYMEYGEKIKKLQNKALADLEEEMNLTCPSIISFRLKQEKLLLFLSDTEQAVPIGMYIVTCLCVIKKSNFINKSVLEWRRRPQRLRTVALFWPFIKAAHKKQRLKLEQGNDEQANSVMLQKQYNDIALKVSQLERYTDQQQTPINDVVDKVNDEASRSNRSISRVNKTKGTQSPSDSSELYTAQALIVSLTASLVDAEKNPLHPMTGLTRPRRPRRW